MVTGLQYFDSWRAASISICNTSGYHEMPGGPFAIGFESTYFSPRPNSQLAIVGSGSGYLKKLVIFDPYGFGSFTFDIGWTSQF